MRVQHINHALNPGKCFIFTDFVQCTYFELQQGNGVTASADKDSYWHDCRADSHCLPSTDYMNA